MQAIKENTDIDLIIKFKNSSTSKSTINKVKRLAHMIRIPYIQDITEQLLYLGVSYLRTRTNPYLIISS